MCLLSSSFVHEVFQLNEAESEVWVEWSVPGIGAAAIGAAGTGAAGAVPHLKTATISFDSNSQDTQEVHLQPANSSERHKTAETNTEAALRHWNPCLKPIILAWRVQIHPPLHLWWASCAGQQLFKVLKTRCNPFSSCFSFHKRILRFVPTYLSSASGPDECDTSEAQRKHSSDSQ